MATDEKVNRTARERSGAVDHAKGLVTLQFFSPLHALLRNDCLYTLGRDKLLERKAVKRLQVTAPALSFLAVFALA